MKTLLIVTLSALIAFSATASDYACKEAYESKLAKLDKTGKVYYKNYQRAFIGTAVVESLFFNTTVVAGSVTVFTPVAVGVFVVGAGWMFYQGDKYESHLTAKAIIEESFTGKSEVEKRQEEAYYSLQNYKAEKKLAKINKKRKKKGLEALSMEDHLKENPIAAFDPASVKTPLTTLVKKLNKNRSDALSYEAVSSLVRSLSLDETFCPKGKALGKRKLQKVLANQI